MKKRALRIIILLWMSWFLCWPLAETMDRWDSLRQDVHDIQFNAGGGATLVAAVFCFALIWFRELRDRFSNVFRTLHQQLPDLGHFQPDALRPALTPDIHSPPFPLRI